MSSTIHVSNIAAATSEEEIRQFFSYCGKISDLSMTKVSEGSESQISATITFERKPAADTALLLDNTELHGNKVKVEAASSLSDLAKGAQASGDAEHEHELRQEDKPRSAVLAEYLSHGYAIADNVLQRGIALDQQHGYSDKFKTYLAKLDEKTNAQATARSVDNTYGVTDKGKEAYNVLQRYFERALNTPTGQKVRSFYEAGSKTALDIHNEALRLKGMRENNTEADSASKSAAHDVGGGKTKCSCGGEGKACSCKPGECACDGCNMTEKTSA